MSNAFDIVKACKKYGVKNIDQLVKILWEGIEEKDQQIAEMQAKIDEKQQRRINLLVKYKDDKKQYSEKLFNENRQLQAKCKELEEKNKNLKIDLNDYMELEEKISTKYDKVVSQLKEQPKQIVEDIKDNIYDLFSAPETIWERYGDTFMDEVFDRIDNLLKKYEEKNEAKN